MAFFLFAPAALLFGQAPPNDLFANRIILAGTNLSVFGSSTNATKEPGEPDHAGNTGGKSVWWTWTAPTNGDLTITTDGSDFDTLLGVYTGPSVGSLSLVANNDDHGIVPTSRVRFQALAGVQYQIAVDGYSNASDVAYGKPAVNLQFVRQPIFRPPNDNFENRIALAGSAPSVTATNTLATRQPGEPLHADRSGDTSLWWTWVPLVSDAVKVATDGSTFDTLLAVYTGTSVSNLTVVASNDDEDPLNAILTSAVTLNVVAGQPYQIAVDGFDGAAGRISLHISSVRLVLSDPMALSSGAFQFTVHGPAGSTNEIQISSNLLTWASVATLGNTNGVFVFTDSSAANVTGRFYRALLK